MRSLLEMVPSIAAHDAPVLILGECGVGKRTLARVIHAASPRRARQLAVVDGRGLAATPETATLALSRCIHGAAGGALLLDEIGALPDRAQLALALFLEENRRALRKASELRVLATSSRDLDAEVQAGRFRRDLATRMDVVEIRMPSLRERREDIVALAHEFAAAFAGHEGRPAPEFTVQARQALLAYDWPGNIPELRNAVQRAIIVGDGGIVDADALPPKVSGPARAR